MKTLKKSVIVILLYADLVFVSGQDRVSARVTVLGSHVFTTCL